MSERLKLHPTFHDSYLVLILPVSTATTKRAFSAIKHVKTVLHNKMEENFLADSMMIYIERELVEDIDFGFDY
jgi:hypothetical protein